jgi:general stress protein 26
VDELGEHDHVLLTYADPSKNRYVVVTGSAEAVHDPAKAREL